jgi:FixJ family two-component response regulator
VPVVCQVIAGIRLSAPITYASAEAFLDDSKHPVFDCVIVDVQLGDMSGIELGEHLADSDVEMPLIFITAHEDWQSLKQTVSIPHAAFLRKKDPAGVVLDAIRSSIDKA